jgi:hypothetical protein
MKQLYMYLCDVCGFGRERPGICPHCEMPLAEYTKDIQAEYQVDLSNAMKIMSERRWYL